MGEMRLTCPECGAEYRVDDSAIPAEGRDVECSSCGHGWRQPGAVASVWPVAGSEIGAPRLNRPLSESVLSVLREEADLARRQRGDVAAPDVVAEPDEATVILATDPPMAGPAPSRHINSRPRRPTDAAPAQDKLEATVNRTTPHGLTVEPLHEEESPVAGGRRGYAKGFGLAIALAAALLLTYVAAPKTEGQGQLAAFRLAVDDGRIWLHQQVLGDNGE